MKTRPHTLAQLGYRLGSRINAPAEFTSTHAWSTLHYNFQIDAVARIGRRSSVGPNPSTYFSLLPLVQQRHKPHLHPGRPLKVIFATVAAAAIVLLLYPLYPAAQYQVQKQVAQTVSHTNALAAAPAQVSALNRIVIPKIGVDTAILEGSSLAVLNKHDGVWHETGTESNNLVLAGHRFKYLPPNTTTLYSLDKLGTGDTIVMDWYHKRYIYVVTGTATVTKHDIAIRNPTPTPTLTIYSCEEKNQAHRIVVTAKRLD